VALWSAGTVVAAVSPSYPVLLASRVLYAAGYAAQARSQTRALFATRLLTLTLS
jgi:predicted MFS family arabinose efflux permease